jgi:glycosyltransferase involved in cell wall biosynthesis
LARRSRCDNQRLRILHAIHDFLPRHQAGSEIYAYELCRALAADHHVTVLCADYDTARAHGRIVWRVYGGIPVAEIINNWAVASFAETYRSPLMASRIAQVLRAVQPHVIHVHNLLNLSFDLPAIAQAQAIPVVATLHDYGLVCPSGGQRLHRAEQHVCNVIDTERCVRCFRESPFFAQSAFGRVAAATSTPRAVGHIVRTLARMWPTMTARAAGAISRVPVLPITSEHIESRLAAARAAFDEVDLVVAPSPSIASEFRRLGFDASKIRVADYGFVPLTRQPSVAKSGRLRIGYVGTLVWHKGVHVLIDAVRGLPVDAYELKIFGDTATFPDYTTHLIGLAAGLPIEFVGRIARARISEAYAQLDVLVVPSIWLENSPLVIHEAFMAGVPVVGARIGGIPDLVTDGVNGLLYDPTSSAELRLVLQRLIDSPLQLTSLARAIPTVKSLADDVRAWGEIYREVVQRREAVGPAA